MRDGLPEAMPRAGDPIVVEVELCGRLADAAKSVVPVVIPKAGCSAAGLLETVAHDWPELAEDVARGKVRVCVNDTVVAADAPLSPGDVIALFPPVSGG